MKEQQARRRYTKPTISSEKVFEQAALACSVQAFPGALPNLSVKIAVTTCGFVSS